MGINAGLYLFFIWKQVCRNIGQKVLFFLFPLLIYSYPTVLLYCDLRKEKRLCTKIKSYLEADC